MCTRLPRFEILKGCYYKTRAIYTIYCYYVNTLLCAIEIEYEWVASSSSRITYVIELNFVSASVSGAYSIQTDLKVLDIA